MVKICLEFKQLPYFALKLLWRNYFVHFLFINIVWIKSRYCYCIGVIRAGMNTYRDPVKSVIVSLYVCEIHYFVLKCCKNVRLIQWSTQTELHQYCYQFPRLFCFLPATVTFGLSASERRHSQQSIPECEGGNVEREPFSIDRYAPARVTHTDRPTDCGCTRV